MTIDDQPPRKNGSIEHHDVVVIGAGISGMYAVHHLREMGLSVRAYNGASDVGGTWWYNRYPGARVDGPGRPFYCYTFSEELMKEWDWAETQSEQSAVLEYIEHVADRFDLRRDIQFETWVRDARYDEAAQRWTVETDAGTRASARRVADAVVSLKPLPHDCRSPSDACPLHGNLVYSTPLRGIFRKAAMLSRARCSVHAYVLYCESRNAGIGNREDASCRLL